MRFSDWSSATIALYCSPTISCHHELKHQRHKEDKEKEMEWKNLR